jgi:hypothetical protein
MRLATTFDSWDARMDLLGTIGKNTLKLCLSVSYVCIFYRRVFSIEKNAISLLLSLVIYILNKNMKARWWDRR